MPCFEAVKLSGCATHHIPMCLCAAPQARQAGRAQLQQQLFDRSQARQKGRQEAPVVAGLSSSLLKDLDATRGHLSPCWVAGEARTMLALASWSACIAQERA